MNVTPIKVKPESGSVPVKKRQQIEHGACCAVKKEKKQQHIFNNKTVFIFNLQMGGVWKGGGGLKLVHET